MSARIQCAFVFLFDGIGRMYVVENSRGELSAPGGKRESVDATIFDTARREFREETSSDLPEGDYHSFSWTDDTYDTWVYHKTVSDDVAKSLHVGKVTDVDGSEMDARWGLLSARDTRWRNHIRTALRIRLMIQREISQ